MSRRISCLRTPTRKREPLTCAGVPGLVRGSDAQLSPPERVGVSSGLEKGADTYRTHRLTVVELALSVVVGTVVVGAVAGMAAADASGSPLSSHGSGLLKTVA